MSLANTSRGDLPELLGMLIHEDCRVYKHSKPTSHIQPPRNDRFFALIVLRPRHREG